MTNLSDKVDYENSMSTARVSTMTEKHKYPILASRILNYAAVIGGLAYCALMVGYGSRPVDEPKPKASTHSAIQNYKQAVQDLDTGYK